MLSIHCLVKRFKVFIKPNDLKGKEFKFVDASWVMNQPGKGYEFYLKEHLPKAVHFDIDKIADEKSPYPHMIPNVQDFNKAMGNLGINDKDSLVVYDKDGTVSSCRVYWTFKLFNHDNIKILNGGLPLWRSLGLETETGNSHPTKCSYNGTLNKKLKRTFEDILANKYEIVVDARSVGRFNGTDKEPRPIPSGHIPNSINIPFTDFLMENKTVKPINEIRTILKEKNLDPSKQIICSCGSGVTASVLYAVFEELKFKNISVYDGSWTEYIQRIQK